MSRPRGRPASSTRLKRGDCAALPVRMVLPGRLTSEPRYRNTRSRQHWRRAAILHQTAGNSDRSCLALFLPTVWKESGHALLSAWFGEPGCRGCLRTRVLRANTNTRPRGWSSRAPSLDGTRRGASCDFVGSTRVPESRQHGWCPRERRGARYNRPRASCERVG